MALVVKLRESLRPTTSRQAGEVRVLADGRGNSEKTFMNPTRRKMEDIKKGNLAPMVDFAETYNRGEKIIMDTEQEGFVTMNGYVFYTLEVLPHHEGPVIISAEGLDPNVRAFPHLYISKRHQLPSRNKFEWKGTKATLFNHVVIEKGPYSAGTYSIAVYGYGLMSQKGVSFNIRVSSS